MSPPRDKAGARGAALAFAALAFPSLVLAAAPGCDDKFQAFLANASKREADRQGKKAEEEARKARKEAVISPAVRRALDLVRTSDYDFVAVKGDRSSRRYNGLDFAAMLESKTRWLGRGIDDLPTWLDQIGGETFFGARQYLVRLPNGRELNFRAWLEAELSALPTTATEDPS